MRETKTALARERDRIRDTMSTNAEYLNVQTKFMDVTLKLLDVFTQPTSDMDTVRKHVCGYVATVSGLLDQAAAAGYDVGRDEGYYHGRRAAS